MNKKLENKELTKRILERLHKKDTEDFSEEELESIENIGLTGKLVNGKETGIDIEDIFLFKNLKSLTLRNFSLTLEDLEKLSKHISIEEISFLGCCFEDVNFDVLSRIPSRLKFIYCSKLPLKFSNIKKLMISFCELDFETIDFSSISSIFIQNSKVENVKDLTEYENLLEVNLDGSELTQKDGKSISDIRVRENCMYSHREKSKLYEDDMIENKEEMER